MTERIEHGPALVCKQCAEPLVGKQRMWCSRECRDTATGERRPEPYPKRECVVCGTTFQPTSQRQTYCPPTAADKARLKGQPRSRCYWAVERARRLGVQPEMPRPLIQSYNCAQCGKHCIPGDNVVPHASRFCGAPCKKEWHLIHVVGRDATREQRAQAQAQARSDEWIAKLLAPATRLQEARYKRALRADPCAYCGTTPSGIDHIVPSSKTGTDDWTNWAGCCRSCNTLKSNLALLLALPFVPVATDYHAQRRFLFAG